MDIWAFIDRNDTATPFWRTTSANSQRSNDSGASNAPTEPPRKVIGASYSHADVLNLSQLSVAGDTRPRTPPSNPRSTSYGNRNTPPPGSSSVVTSPPTRRGNSSLLAETSSAWSPAEDEEDHFGVDDDEDEFGLPSIANMRRKGKRASNKRGQDPGGGTSKSNNTTRNGTSTTPASMSSWALDNGDITEERAQTIPTYPSTRPSPTFSNQKILRPQYKDILCDPANSLHLISHPPIQPTASPKDIDAHAARITRINKFKKILQASSISLPELRNLAWSGLPPEVRAMSWQILLNYLPTSSERRVATLERKRKEYLDSVRQAFERPTTSSGSPILSSTTSPASPARAPRGLDEVLWHQITIDVPRTNPTLPLYRHPTTQRSLERILYVWAIRHPASGYVQGINDLVTPFFQVFLGQYITSSSDPSDDMSNFDPGQLPKVVLDAVEADTYWCLTALLSGIQDNYIHAQPGIVRQVQALRDLVSRIDGGLAKHLEKEGVEFIQFSFRWMNCLLMREVSVENVVRMWDTYLAEETGFSTFHLYVCAAFLVKWSNELQTMDFQDIMIFLQALPTKGWTAKDVELLLSEAFIWKSLFEGTRGHVTTQSTPGGQFLNL
ncbi:GTPase-activating protein gyp1 [Zymoseptoria brevis]|uniref:GTPase-activating protein gyp1 n=1 Tax=Zymoseptoria brevis TaxID=1047168 RepID=A0A0F4GL08_9PEZI|nr:GTPase-activating protein gyp1 [Zymoseptoria brevis]